MRVRFLDGDRTGQTLELPDSLDRFIDYANGDYLVYLIWRTEMGTFEASTARSVEGHKRVAEHFYHRLMRPSR